MVSIAISAVILTVVIFNQNKYTAAAGLSNAAQSIAADLSTAQTYGVSVKQLSAGNFNTAYGVHFRSSSGGGINPNNPDYVFFADSNKDGRYGNTTAWASNSTATCPSPAGECLNRNRLGSEVYFVGAFCYIPTAGATCATQTTAGSAVTNIHRIDVTFSRPQTKAKFVLYNSSGTVLNATAIGVGIRIRNSATPSATKWIYIYETGQISVQ